MAVPLEGATALCEFWNLHGKVSAILIGYEESLAGMKESEIRKVQEALKRFLGEHSLELIGSSESISLREEAAAVMNRALGRQAIADVFFCSLAVGEAM